MSCPTATAPIDISLASITGKCDYKCAYSFSYNNSSCVATNRGDYISLSYDGSSSPPVVYNSAGYDVKEIRLYSPSLHSFSSRKTDAELIIIHSSNTGAKPLLVCVPIKSNNSSSESALFFKTVIDTISNSAPSDGESTTVNATYNLSSFVPKKPFYSYSATEPYQPCSDNVDYIVFGPLMSSVDISPDTLTKLQTIISLNPYDIKSGPKLFYNEKGPGSGGSGGNDIYIDCQPVGSSEESTEIITDMGGGSVDFKDWLNSPLIKLILGALVFILILYGTKLLLNMIKPSKGGAIESVTEVIKGGAKWRK
jgi:carbonic anhydrase